MAWLMMCHLSNCVFGGRCLSELNKPAPFRGRFVMEAPCFFERHLSKLDKLFEWGLNSRFMDGQ